MFEYDFINTSEDCRELKLFPEKIKEVVNDLKRITKTKQPIFVKFLTTCLDYYNNIWYSVQHMMQVEFNSSRLIKLLI